MSAGLSVPAGDIPVAARLPGGDQVPPVRRVLRRRWPATGPARCRRAEPPASSPRLIRPSRRPCWLSRVVQRERRRQQPRADLLAGWPGRRPRRGSRPRREPGQQLRSRRSLAGCRMPAAGRHGRHAVPASGAGQPVSQRVLAEQPVRLSARYPAPAAPARRTGSRCRAWNASTASITSSGSGFRYSWVVDRWACPSTHCTSVSGIAGSRAIR